MLTLKKLELFGFKSFCDRQELHFSGSGIASIVGPNGCGKSNISDAVSWVLGEQSAKSLRGQRMMDVIFNGSRDRKPSGMATVSVTLLDPEARSQARPTNGSGAQSGRPRPGEITVTRKLFRSGESIYLMNSKQCRLRDIQDLFMGTGLGPNHYAIIEQGRIGQLLTSRPLDRRGFVEEAAGITKFKSRKRLAELKLEHARRNLNRVNDILQEVTRQANSLKRQASKARRYAEYREQLVEAASLVMAERYRRLDERTRRAGESMAEAEGQYRKRIERAEEMDAELEAKRRQERSWESELEQGRQELARLTVETERLRSRLDEQKRTAAEHAERARLAETETGAIDERLEQLGKELEADRAAAEEVEGQVAEVRARVAEKTAELDKLRTGIRGVEEQREGSRKRVLALLGEVSGLNNQLATIEEFLAGTERQIARAREEQRAASEESIRLEARRRELAEQSDRLQEQLEQSSRATAQVESGIERLRAEERSRRGAAERLQRDLSRISARRDSLEQILSHHAYTTETVKDLFAAIARDRPEGFAPIGILADFIEVDPRYEQAAEEFLREELEFIVVKGWGEARRGVEIVRSDVKGRATFLVHPEDPFPGEEPALGPETGVLGRLADAVRLTNGLGKSASILLPKLRGCYLVEDEEVARKLALRYPDLYFLLPDGVCHRGYTVSGGGKSSAGPLALKRELRELRPKTEKLEVACEENRRAADEAEQGVNEKTAERERLRGEAQSLEKKALTFEHEIRQLNEEAQRAQRRDAAAGLEIERLTKETERAAAERVQRREEIALREGEREESEAGMERLTARFDELQAALRALTEEQTGLRAEAAALEERRRSAAVAVERVSQLVEEQKQRREQVLARIKQWVAERERLLTDNEQLEKQSGENARRQETLGGKVEELARKLEASRADTASLEEQVKALRIELEQVRQRRSEIELQVVQLRSDIKHLGETCEGELGRPIEEIAAAHPDPLDDEQAEEAEGLRRELKEKIERLGPVNVLALEEYREAEQRQEFLETQQRDLLDSIRDTQQAIHEIDNASKEKFEEAFQAINEHFKTIFSTLFGGGVGEMRLSDPDNPGESGIDIVASPPGKRLQNIALLSGGEKSLTALALLMATFRYRPSPFCVLDEVDAALDEPNIVRFRRLLESMADTTQFIIITHSKTTMEAAQTLFGVTMGEPGVSKLVSVRIAEHHRPSAGPSARAAEAAAVPVGA